MFNSLLYYVEIVIYKENIIKHQKILLPLVHTNKNKPCAYLQMRERMDQHNQYLSSHCQHYCTVTLQGTLAWPAIKTMFIALKESACKKLMIY